MAYPNRKDKAKSKQAWLESGLSAKRPYSMTTTYDSLGVEEGIAFSTADWTLIAVSSTAWLTDSLASRAAMRASFMAKCILSPAP